MTPWQWWATRECCRAVGEWDLGEFDTRAKAIAAANDEYSPGTAYFVIEARTSTDARYYTGSVDFIPFAKTRNEERLVASAETPAQTPPGDSSCKV